MFYLEGKKTNVTHDMPKQARRESGGIDPNHSRPRTRSRLLVNNTL